MTNFDIAQAIPKPSVAQYKTSNKEETEEYASK
jgi:hypothetical protein